MAKRKSSKERMERLAEENEAAELEKAAEKSKKKKKKAPARKKKVAAPKREKTVWKVYSPTYKEQASYPYPEKNKAEAHAAKLTKKTGNEHFVNSAKVPMDDDE
jgi:hypothetical protein